MAAPVRSAVQQALRPYQRREATFLVDTRQGRGINGSEQGLGKTVTTLACAERLAPRGDILILCPKIAIGVWQEHIYTYCGERATVYTGTPQARRALKLGPGVRWLIAPYSQGPELLGRRRAFTLIIQDEAQWLRNPAATRVTVSPTGRRTKVPTTLFGTVRYFQSEFLLSLTGTPMVNDGRDLWTLLHMVAPRDFPSFWRFQEEYFYVWRDRFGAPTIRLRNQAKWFALLDRYMVRHLAADVLPELPPFVRQRIPCTMTPAQARVYRQIVKDVLVEWGDGEVLLIPSRMAQLTRLRQVLVSPALIGGPASSGALLALTEALQNDFEAGRAALVFTPFNGAFPYLKAIADKLHARCGFIHGGLSAAEITRTVAQFQAGDTHKQVLFSQVLMGAAWTATRASEVYFLGSDWRPSYNEQAERRSYRFGQTHTVHSNYLVHAGTVDDHVMRIQQGKLSWQALVNQVGARALLLPEAA